MTRWRVKSSPTYKGPFDLAPEHVFVAMRRSKKAWKKPTAVAIETRAHPTHGSFRCRASPYLFGMVKNSEPSHKCHRATLPNRRKDPGEARGVRPLAVGLARHEVG